MSAILRWIRTVLQFLEILRLLNVLRRMLVEFMDSLRSNSGAQEAA